MTSYKVLYSFQGRDASELTVNENDIVVSSEEPQDGWLNASFNANFGFVPITYLEEIPIPSPSPPPPPPPQPIQSQNSPNNQLAYPTNQSNTGSDQNSDYNGGSYQDSIPPGADCSNFQNKTTLGTNFTHRKAESTYSTGTVRVIGDPYQQDPIGNIVGRTMVGEFRRSGVENFMVGLASGKHSQASITYDSMEIKVVDSHESCKFCVAGDEDWTIQVVGREQDQRGNILYEVKADPDLPERFQMPSGNSIRRKLSDFKWLDTRLRLKYPFIYIPRVPQDESMIQLNAWFECISQHPIIRNSHYVKIFMIISDRDLFKAAKKRTEAGKDSDKNLKEEMLLQIKVNPESKINEDLRAYMSDIKQSTEVRKTSYNQTTNQLDQFVKIHQTQAHNQNIALDSLKRRMNEFSIEQGKVEIMGSRGLSSAARCTVQHLEQLQDINKNRISNSSMFTNRNITYSQCTGTWSEEGGKMMEEMIKRYSTIETKKTEHKLSRDQYANAKERTKNLIAIHEAEHHHQLKMNNKVIKESMQEYLRLHTRYMEEELQVYRNMMAAFESIEIPE